MRKFTKKLVSGIVAVSMLFTTVFTNTVMVSATEYTPETLEGLSFSSTTSGTTKTSTWGFNSTEPADKNGTVNGNVDSKIYSGDVLSGIVVTATDSTAAKSWNDGNQLALSTKMGMNVPVSSNVKSGTITITGTQNKNTRYLVLNGDSSKTLVLSKNGSSLSFTASDVVNGYLVFSNENSDGDYKITNIVLTETLDAVATTTTTTETTTTTTTTETTTATTTETTTVASDNSTETTTVASDNSTETTTVAPAVSGSASLVANVETKNFTELGKEFTVTFDVKNSTGFNNVTGFVQFDPEVIEITGLKVLGTATADELSLIPTNTVGGYEYLDSSNTKTAAQLGNVKVSVIKGYPNTLEDITGDANLLELTFKTVANGTSVINFVPYGDFVNTSNAKVNVSITNTSVTVNTSSAPVAKTAKLNVTATKTEFDTIGEAFNVDFSVAENEGFNNITGFIEYDSSVVTLDSVTDGLFTNFVTNASEVPDNTVEGYEYLDANNTKTAAQLGKVKFAYIAQTSGSNYDITNNGTLFTASFKTVNKGTSAINVVLLEDAKNTLNQTVKFTISNTSVNVTAEKKVAEEIKLGIELVDATVTPATETAAATYKYTVDKDNKEITVNYILKDNKSGIDNATFFIEFDPTILTPTAVSSTVLNIGEAADIIDYVPSATNTDFVAFGADGTKTAAQLGALKIAGIADTAITDETATLVTVKYTVTNLGTADFLVAPVVNADGLANWGVIAEGGNISDKARSVSGSEIANVVFDGDLKEDFSYVVTPDSNFTLDANGKYVIPENVTNFKISVEIKGNPGINAFTGNFTFNPELMKLVGATGSDLISDADLKAAMNLVPTAENSDFANLGADGVKTAAEIGHLVLANYMSEGVNITTDGAIFTFEFEKTGFGGDVTVMYTDIQTTNANLENIAEPTVNKLSFTIAGDPKPQSKAHLLGNVTHSGNITATDAAYVLSYAKNLANADSDTTLEIANVDGKDGVTATDAGHVLAKARNTQYLFSNITGGRTDIEATETFAEYIQVPADYTCSCPEAVG